MATSFDELFAAAAGPVLFASGGETVTYTHNAVPVTGTAIIERLPPEALGAVGPELAYLAWVPQTLVSAYTLGADTLAFTEHGATLTLKPVQAMDGNGVGGMWHFRLR